MAQVMRSKINVKVYTDATPLQVLQILHKKLKNIRVSDMLLSFNNQQLDDLTKPMSQYGIYNGATLSLKTFSRTANCACAECKRMNQKVTISVEWLSKSVKVDITLGEPVETLKNAIKTMEGIPKSRQKLQFQSQTLEDHKLLASYKFADEESGETEHVVHMLVDNGPPTLFDKLQDMVTIRRSKAPAPRATELIGALP